MTEHAVVTREKWLAARKELLDETHKHAERTFRKDEYPAS